MNTIITGCSCCLKSSVIEELGRLGKNVIPSDSNMMEDLRNVELINWEFKPRLLMKYSLLKQLNKLKIPVYIERSMLDELIFCTLTNLDWFDMDTELDDDIIMSKFSDWLSLEKDLNIVEYHFLYMKDKDFINHIISDPDFDNSKRADSYCTVDQYFQFQELFYNIYEDNLQLIDKKLIVHYIDKVGCIKTTVDDLVKEILL